MYILPKHPHITKLTQTHALQNTHTHTQTHITKQYKATTVQIKKHSTKYTQMKQSQYTYYQNTHTLQNSHKHTHYKTHTYPHTHTHPHITKQYKTTTVQIKTKTMQDIPK